MKNVFEGSVCGQRQFQVNTLDSADGGAQAVPDQSDMGNRMVGKHPLHCREDRCGTRCLGVGETA